MAEGFAQSQADRDAQDAAALSQTFAVLDRPSEALEAIERAFELSPESVEFLRARATLATWSGDYGRARDSYERLAKLRPDDHDVVLNLGRVNAWAGRTDAAVDAYHAVPAPRARRGRRLDRAGADRRVARQLWRGLA